MTAFGLGSRQPDLDRFLLAIPSFRMSSVTSTQVGGFSEVIFSILM